METPPSPRPSLKQLVRRARDSWATRSLAVGAVAAGLDILTLLVCVKWLGWSNPLGAMAGVVVGGTFAFFGNRRFAFRDRGPGVWAQALRFVLATGSAMLVHAGVVWLFADKLGLPVVAAKLAADVLVFSVGQPFVLRYLVFKHPPAESAEPAEPPTPRHLGGTSLPPTEATETSAEEHLPRAAGATGPGRASD